MRAVIFVIGALALASCREPAVYFAPPAQSPPLGDFKVPPARVLNVSDPNAPSLFVRDITSVGAGDWLFTGERPAARVRVRTTANLRYVIDFAIPEATFKDTGPVTITFTINDHVLDRVRYTSTGPKHFEKLVPPDWLQEYSDATVGAEIDKVWVSKLDGAGLGFILVRIGLTQ